MLRAAAVYAALAFAAGFALGAVRTLAVEPRIGALSAVALEAPLMLIWSWLACAWTLRRFPVRNALLPRLVLGALAFALLLALELALAALLGRTLAEAARSYATPAGRLGLAAQAAFALIPAAQGLLSSRGSRR